MAFVSRGPFSPQVLLATTFILLSCGIKCGQSYQATVFEFKPESPRQGQNLSRTQALAFMRKNIDTYKMQARIAGESGNDIIVFPEYGLFGIFGYAKYSRRSDIYPFLETIPDPKKVSWNPCLERMPTYPSTEIQKELSCMAKNYDIYVVANVGEKVACKKRYDSSCPNDGRYQYNTNVVYSSNGALVAKYRKKHLFNEHHYDSPSKVELVTFNSHFGKFGLITSYDSLFKSPMLDLVNELKVRDIAMPTAWMTSKPLSRAIQWHSSLARGLEINLLVSTVHDGHCKSYGSGIYGPDGEKKFVSNPDDYSPKRRSSLLRPITYFETRQQHIIPTGQMGQTKTYNDSMEIFGTNVTLKFFELFRRMDDINICYGRFCCRLNYTVSDEKIEKYALAVYKGPVRTLGNLLAVEMCALVRCTPKCGQPIQKSKTYFKRLHLVGVNFSTSYIYPQVLIFNGHDEELYKHQWVYKHGQIIFDEVEHPLHSASLIGRVYEKDKRDYRSPYVAEVGGRHFSDNYAPAIHCTSVFILIVAFIASLIFSS